MPSEKLFHIDAKWTHTGGVRGWKHYRIVTLRGEGTERELELMAICDRSVRFWVNELEFRNDPQWNPGWL